MPAQAFNFTATPWLYPSPSAAWVFVSLPPELSQLLDTIYSHQKRGWGSLKVQVTIGTSTWATSIFPDKKSNTYLLPLKTKIRQTENIEVNKEVACTITIVEK